MNGSRHAGGTDRTLGGRWGRWIGAAMLLHFLAVCAIKARLGLGAEACWLSHVALALAGLGLLVRSARLALVALVTIGLGHACWLADFAIGAATGHHPLGVSGSVLQGDALQWVTTAHHFYLLPLLLAIVLRNGEFPSHVLTAAALLCIALTCAGRFMLPPWLNVNAAFAMLPRVDSAMMRWINQQPAWSHLAIVNGIVIGGLMLPAWWLLRAAIGRPSRSMRPGEAVNPACAGCENPIRRAA